MNLDLIFEMHISVKWKLQICVLLAFIFIVFDLKSIQGINEGMLMEEMSHKVVLGGTNCYKLSLIMSRA